MNKTGAGNMWWIVGAIIALFALGIMILIVGGGLRAGWSDIKEALGIPSKHIEALKGTIPEVKKMEKEADIILQFLIDAAEYIKDGKYDDAIKQYVMYYKKCEKHKWVGYGCGIAAGMKEGIKFRVLNALREKYFKNPELKISKSDLDSTSTIGINKEEVNCAVLLAKLAANVEKGNDKNIVSYAKDYTNNCIGKDKNEFSTLYWEVVSRYGSGHLSPKSFVSGMPLCNDALRYSKDLINKANGYLRVFETNTGIWKDKVEFTVSDYQFLEIPSKRINNACKSA